MAIDLSQIVSVKQDIHPDLIVSMSGVTNKHLLDLKVNILRGIENKDVIVVFDGNTHLATRYDVTKSSRSALGKAVERPLQVVNDISYVPDNLQNYRSKIVGSVLGVSSNGFTTDKIEQQLRLQAALFGNHVIYNFFHGDTAKESKDFYGLYDGILTLLEKDKTAGLISEAKGNLVTLGTIDIEDHKSCYDAFIKFYQSMNGSLADDCIIYTTPELYNAIVRGYAETFVGAQNTIVNAINKNIFESHEADGAILKKTVLLGTGTGFIATKPGNIDYGTDLTGQEDPSEAYISVTSDSIDPLNSILLGMQCASGARVRDFNKTALCISDYKFTAPKQDENTTLTEKDIATLSNAQLDVLVQKLAAELGSSVKIPVPGQGGADVQGEGTKGEGAGDL